MPEKMVDKTNVLRNKVENAPNSANIRIYNNLPVMCFKGKPPVNASHKILFLVSVSAESGQSKDAIREGLVKIQIICKRMIDLSKDSMKFLVNQYAVLGKLIPSVFCSLDGNIAVLHKCNLIQTICAESISNSN